MVDLPQHAGQLALLRDLLFRRSPWASQLQVNFLTPYLLGYFLALPLALFVTPLIAMKVVLSFAYLAFVGACRSIRKALGSSDALDALFCLPFFGFAYSWGFYSYLVAAPVGLVFIRIAIAFGRGQAPRTGFLTAALAVAMLFSHGLVFLFACAVGGGVLLARATGPLDLARRTSPFVAPGVVAILLFLAMRQHETQITGDFDRTIQMGPIIQRIYMLISNSLDSPTGLWAIPVFFTLLAMPVVGGLTIDWRRREPMAIAITACALMLFSPSFAWSTAKLFERLTLFLLPTYAWLFTAPRETPTGLARRCAPYLSTACAAAVGGLLVMHLVEGLAFSREAADFDRVMAAAQPRQRALMLIFDRHSQAKVNPVAYLHWAAWYAAEKQGFVDLSFAVFPPEMVRFRLATAPAVREGFEWFPQSFDWRRHQGWRYRYFFVRSKGAAEPAALAMQPRVGLIARTGEWRLYEYRSTLVAPSTPILPSRPEMRPPPA